jgi:WD40 repeat protein
LTASDDKTARLWRIESGKEIIKPIQHESPVWAADISPDGTMIATGSEDSTVQLWDLSNSGEGATLKNHTTLRLSDGPVWWLKLHDDPSGTNLGIGGQDRTIRVFTVNRFKTLFSNPDTLEKEAEAQGGLIVGDVSGEPQIESVPVDAFKARQLDPGLHAAVEMRHWVAKSP